MLCRKCGKHNATSHIRQTINGQTTELYLCADCAREMGFDHLFTPTSFDFDDLFGAFFGNNLLKGSATPAPSTKRCPECGASFYEISKSGRMGCPACYRSFSEELMPSIARIHGATTHTGNHPQGPEETIEITAEPSPIDRMKEELSAAIETQNFEEAARLRDEIRRLEGAE